MCSSNSRSVTRGHDDVLQRTKSSTSVPLHRVCIFRHLISCHRQMPPPPEWAPSSTASSFSSPPLPSTPLLNWRLSQNSIISWGKNVTTFVLDISNTIPRISHSVMHKQSWLLLLLSPSVGRYSQIRAKNSVYWKLFTHNGSFLHLWHLWQNIQN